MELGKESTKLREEPTKVWDESAKLDGESISDHDKSPESASLLGGLPGGLPGGLAGEIEAEIRTGEKEIVELLGEVGI